MSEETGSEGPRPRESQNTFFAAGQTLPVELSSYPGLLDRCPNVT